MDKSKVQSLPRWGAGFTMVELIITIAILAVGLVLAVPSIRVTMANNQIAVANNSIMAGFNLARSEAITRGNGVVICPSRDGNNCDNNRWNTGWIVFDDTDGNGVMVAEEMIRSSSRESDVTRSGLSGNVTFQADGTTTLGASTSITICFSNLAITTKCREISINRFGAITSKSSTASANS